MILIFIKEMSIYKDIDSVIKKQSLKRILLYKKKKSTYPQRKI